MQFGLFLQLPAKKPGWGYVGFLHGLKVLELAWGQLLPVIMLFMYIPRTLLCT